MSQETSRATGRLETYTQGPLAGAARWRFEVAGVEEVTPRMRRLWLHADGLRDLGHQPGQDLMLAVPVAEGATVNRRYSIRHTDAEREAVAVDVVRHGDGPAARWAELARPGDVIDAIGPRGRIVVDAEAAWHLFVGDESALPATLAMLEAVPAGAPAVALLEVDGPEEEQDAPAGTVVWVHRKGVEPGEAGPLLAALDQVALPEGQGRAYVAGERRVVAAVRRRLRERGVDDSWISPKAYWSRGQANAAHGEPLRD